MPMTPSRCSVEPVSPSASEYAFQRLGCPSIVMVQPTQDRIREHLARLVQRRCRKHRRLRNPLPKPLMRAGLMKVQDIVLEKALELLFMQDQDVMQAFSSHASQKAFTDSIGCGVGYGVRSTLMPLVAATRAKLGPNVRSVSRMRYVGVCPYGVA